MSEGRVDRPDLEASLERLVASTALPPEHGFFGPRSFAWRMFRERALVTYAPRAVMLQYAYPPFAAASASYGAHASNPGARFERAVSTLLAMIFGPRERVLRDARRLFLLHDRLHGTTEQGTPFHGNDRESLAWVLVTLLDASIRGYERHVGHVDAPALFADVRRFAMLFGLAAGELPSSRAALDQAVTDALARTLVVGTETRAMWRFLGERRRDALVRSWTAATLPPPLRQALVPDMDDKRAERIERAGSLLRARILPRSARYVRAYAEARARLRA